MTAARALCAVVWCCVSLLGAAQAPGGSWNTYHGDYALTGVGEGAVSVQPVRQWRLRVGSELCSPVVGGDGQLFCIADESVVTGLDTSGKKLWSRRMARVLSRDGGAAAEESFSAPPLYVDGALLVVASDKGVVYGLSPKNGTERWRFATGGRIQGTPNYAAGEAGQGAQVVVVTKEDGVLHAADATDGSILWTSGKTQRTDGHLAIFGGQAVYGNCASAFFGVSLASGKQTGSVRLGEECEMAGGVSVADGVAFAGNRSGSIVGVGVDPYELLWQRETSGGESFATPAVGGQCVVVSSGDARIYALARETGRQLWMHESGGMDAGSPVIVGEHVVVPVDGRLLCLGLSDGVRAWQLDIGDEITAPAVVDGLLVVGTDDGFVVAYGAP